MSKESNTLNRPILDFKEVKKVVLDLYGLKVMKISELNGYYDKNFHVLVNETVNNNGNIEKIVNEGYVLKIVNTLESEDAQLFEAQTKLMAFLNENRIRCPKTVLTKDGKPFDTIMLPSGVHIVRLLEFIPGDILYNVENPSEEVLYQVGALTAQIDNVLENFHHPAYTNKYLQWCLRSAPGEVVKFLQAVDEPRQNLVQRIMSEFSSRVIKIEDELRKGIIYGDINEQNLIVETDDDTVTIKAVIDFGDTHECWYLYELAIAMTYMIMTTDNIDSGGHVLAGYLSNRHLSDKEFSLLKICVMARFCQSLVLGAHANKEDPSNEYVLITAKTGWGLLEQLSNLTEEEVLSRWREISQNQTSSK